MRLTCQCGHRPKDSTGRCEESGEKSPQEPHLCPYELIMNKREIYCKCCIGCTILCLPKKTIQRQPEEIHKGSYDNCKDLFDNK